MNFIERTQGQNSILSCYSGSKPYRISRELLEMKCCIGTLRWFLLLVGNNSLVFICVIALSEALGLRYTGETVINQKEKKATVF